MADGPNSYPKERASPGSIASLLGLAEKMLRAGRHEAALQPLLEAARRMPDHPAVLHDLGVVCLRTRRLRESIRWLRRAAEVRPSFAPTHYSLGLALAQSADYEGALAAFRRATQLVPTMAEAHGRMADILMRKARHDEAAAAYRAAHAASPRTTQGRLCGAKGMLAQDRRAEAEDLLLELIAEDDSSSEAHLVLATLLNEAGRFDQALLHFERSLALAPWQATAYHGLVSARRVTEADRPLLARILARLDATDLSERQRVTLHFAAGKALDDLRDYAGAIRHFDAANELRRGLCPPFDRHYLAKRVDDLIAHFTSELFASQASTGDGDETPVLVLGMPRSGTTLIERIISSHPQAAGGGELGFWNACGSAWSDADGAALSKAGPQIRADYLQLLGRIDPDAVRVTDKMPFNFFWVGLVHFIFPRARFVHCRRNPIDTCLSIYLTPFSQNWGYASDRGDLAFYYRQYVRLMAHWRSVVPPGQFLDVDYEEATAAPDELAPRLISFCGLPWDAQCLQPERNPDVVKTASSWQVRQPIYRTSVERWRNYQPWIGELAQLEPGNAT